MGLKTGQTQNEARKCFVVIGFGTKTDLLTGRKINLDRTYQKLIKPALNAAGVECFRAIDKNRSGSIDALMYRWLFEADLVVADLSTLNANVLYELGVRHAQRPNTTVLIAESELLRNIPFDLSHTVIHPYEVIDGEISDQEASRLGSVITGMVGSLQEEPETDSPVYVHLPGMTPPILGEPGGAGESEASPVALLQDSPASLMGSADQEAGAGNYTRAIELYERVLEQVPADDHVRRQLVSAIFKRAVSAADPESAIQVLRAGEEVLEACSPNLTTDPQTLGLAARFKEELGQRTEDPELTETAIYLYERAFYIQQDYLNGMKSAYLNTLQARKERDASRARARHGHARQIWILVARLCERLINSPSFSLRADRARVLESLALAYLGLSQRPKAEALIPRIAVLSETPLDWESFLARHRELIEAEKFLSEDSRLSEAAPRTPGQMPPPEGALRYYWRNYWAIPVIALAVLIIIFSNRQSDLDASRQITQFFSEEPSSIPDLGPVLVRLDGLVSALSDSEERGSFREIRRELGDLEVELRQLRVRLALGGIELDPAEFERIAAFWKQMLDQRESVVEPQDLDPVFLDRLETILGFVSQATDFEAEFSRLEAKLNQIIDLEGGRLGNEIPWIRRRLEGIDLERLPGSLSSIHNRLQSLESNISVHSTTMNDFNELFLTRLDSINNLIGQSGQPLESFGGPHIQFRNLQSPELEKGFKYFLQVSQEETPIEELNLSLQHRRISAETIGDFAVLDWEKKKTLYPSTQVRKGSEISFQHGRYSYKLALDNVTGWEVTVRILVPMP